MKKCGILLLFFAAFFAALWGCGRAENEKESDRKEVDYTVMDVRKLPKELLKIIEENKKDEIRMTYTDGDAMYLVRGYGQQKTGGYSIEVVQCTEDEESILLDTRLIGPSGQKKLAEDSSYPFLAVKIEKRDKEVQIQ